MMSQPEIILLITRPQAASEVFIKACSAILSENIRVIISPLLEIVPTHVTVDLQGMTGVIFTSANGVAHGPKTGFLPAYCVGLETTKAARQRGWKSQYLGETSADLIQSLIGQKHPGNLAHIGGIHRRGSVAQHLKDNEISTTEIDVYDQVLQEFSPAAGSALNGEHPVIVPLFSPRTARQFAAQKQGSAPLHLIALSDAISCEVQGLSACSLTVLPQADRKTMIETLGNVLRRVETGDAAQ